MSKGVKDNSELKNMLIEQQNMMLKVIENGVDRKSTRLNSSH